MLNSILMAGKWFGPKDAIATVASNLISNGVSDYCGGNDDQHHDNRIDAAAAGGDAAKNGGSFSRQNEANEQRILSEDQQADSGVHEQRAQMQDAFDGRAEA